MIRRIVLAALAAVALTGCGPDRPPRGLLTSIEVARADSLLANRSRRTIDEYGYLIDTLDRREILHLLRSHRFDSLDGLLTERWRATQADIRHEGRLAHAYETFMQFNDALERPLKAWIEARPRSAAARVAMAAHQLGNAQQWRGTDVIGRTTDSQRARMFAAADRSLAAATEALALEPGHLTAHIVMVDLLSYSAGADLSTAQARIVQALAANPTSFNLRWAILVTIEPRWGGSMELVREFAATAVEFESQNSKLRAIAGTVPQAEAFLVRNDLDRSLALLDRASAHGTHYHLHIAYAELYSLHGRFVDALAEFDRALAVNPQGRRALIGRSHALLRAGGQVEDIDARERIWSAALDSFRLLWQLRPPNSNPRWQMERLAKAREECAEHAPPCLGVD